LPERDRYIAGVPCWVDTSQPDPDAAAEFYGDLFGWEFEDAMPAGAPGKYLMARLQGGDVAAVSSPPEGARAQAVWNTYIWVENADESAAKTRAAGGSVLSEPLDVMDAGRMAVLADPEGAVFCVWQARAHRGARIVNERGSLNFNALNTRDPEAVDAESDAWGGDKAATSSCVKPYVATSRYLERLVATDYTTSVRRAGKNV
jgi:predicted enzyme related to lactoylglutathione lyase